MPVILLNLGSPEPTRKAGSSLTRMTPKATLVSELHGGQVRAIAIRRRYRRDRPLGRSWSHGVVGGQAVATGTRVLRNRAAEIPEKRSVGIQRSAGVAGVAEASGLNVFRLN